MIQAESPELHPKSSRESPGSEQQRDKTRPEFSKRLFWLRMETGPGEQWGQLGGYLHGGARPLAQNLGSPQ